MGLHHDTFKSIWLSNIYLYIHHWFFKTCWVYQSLHKWLDFFGNPLALWEYEVLKAEIISPLELLHSDEWLAVPRSATAQPHGGDYSGVTDWSGFQMNPSAIYKTVKYFANLQDIYILSLQLRFSKVNEIHHPNRFEEAVNRRTALQTITRWLLAASLYFLATQTCRKEAARSQRVWQIWNPNFIGFQICLCQIDSNDRMTFHPKGHKKPPTKEAKVAKPLKAHRIGPKRLEKKTGWNGCWWWLCR